MKSGAQVLSKLQEYKLCVLKIRLLVLVQKENMTCPGFRYVLIL